MAEVRYGSVCSGIEAVSVAWRGLPFEPQWFAEIAPFPSSVLRHRFPEVPNRGDFTQIRDADIDLLVGGTPCQDFSVAGLRAGLAGERGNLTLEFVRLAARTRPRWVLWENVPGVLSIDGGRAFGAFLGGLGECGYGFAYRVLDAQFFGVPQRRRRVFVVGHLGDWRRAAAVLFESASLRWDPPPSRESGAGVAALSANGVGVSGADDNQAQADHLTAATSSGRGWWDERETAATIRAQDSVTKADTLIAHTLRGKGCDASEDGTGRGTPMVTIGFSPIAGSTRPMHAVEEQAPTLRSPHAGAAGHVAAFAGIQGVRRLTPRECERLQEFPDDWTLVPHNGKPAADGPRYEAIGNSMAVPVLRWIGERIQFTESLTAERAA